MSKMLDLIMEVFNQMWKGNPVAWLCFTLAIIIILTFAIIIFLWWKTPAPAKRLLLNNLRFGGARPVIANAYDDHVLRFFTPTIFAEGITYDSHKGFHFLPRITKETSKAMTADELETATKAFRVEGSSSAFYLAYSGKAVLVNPELLAYIEHPYDMKNPFLQSELQKDKYIKARKLFKELRELLPDHAIKIKKEDLINVLMRIKDKEILIYPLWITRLVNPVKLKQLMPKMWTKSQLLGHEQKVRDLERGKLQRGSIAITAFLLIIILLLQFINLLKTMGAF